MSLESGRNNPSSLVTVGPAVVQTPERGTAFEWLVTNGLGDFGCGTVTGPNTRRQHGLFTVGSLFGGCRMLLLAALDVTLECGGKRHEFSCHQYVGVRYPEGFRYCVKFNADPFPQWRYEVPGAALTQSVFMPQGKRCTVCSWTLEGASSEEPRRLRVRPLLAYREADALTRANPEVEMSFRDEGEMLSLNPYPGCPEFFLHHGGAEIRSNPQWYYRFQHRWDIALGRDGEEDLFSPCEVIFDMTAGQPVGIAAGVERQSRRPDQMEREERGRRAALRLPEIVNDPVADALARAAETFVARDADGEAAIVASYPDSAEDLRSAIIALPGLLLCTRRLEEAKTFIRSALRRLQESEATEAPGDVPLWLIRAGQQYVDHSRDWAFLRETIAPAGERFLQRYIENRSGVGFRLAPDGLLTSLGTSPPLTWMNACVDGWPVTPRTGKPVEVNALWHHALALLSRWSRRQGRTDAVARFDRLRELCGRSFRQRFWNAAEGCLFDVVDAAESQADLAMRPNQLLAVSLPSDLLDRRQARSVLSFIEKRLLTPRGLRTLSLEDPAFRAQYGGSPVERSAARHQGTVFPWLIGAYVDAVFRVHGRTARAYARAEAWLEPFLREHLGEACLGQCSELFNGASPHSSQGAFAHAPAVAELLRAYVEINGRLR